MSAIGVPQDCFHLLRSNFQQVGFFLTIDWLISGWPNLRNIKRCHSDFAALVLSFSSTPLYLGTCSPSSMWRAVHLFDIWAHRLYGSLNIYSDSRKAPNVNASSHVPTSSWQLHWKFETFSTRSSPCRTVIMAASSNGLGPFHFSSHKNARSDWPQEKTDSSLYHWSRKTHRPCWHTIRKSTFGASSTICSLLLTTYSYLADRGNIPPVNHSNFLPSWISWHRNS